MLFFFYEYNCILDACDNVPKPLNGRVECINTKKKGKQCHLYCNEGYAFAFNTPHHKILKNQTVQIVTCHPINHTWNTAIIPDCSGIIINIDMLIEKLRYY